MTEQNKDASRWGAQAARDIVAKKNPRSLSDLVNCIRTIEKHCEKEYPHYSKQWKYAYLGGAEGVLTCVHNKLMKGKK